MNSAVVYQLCVFVQLERWFQTVKTGTMTRRRFLQDRPAALRVCHFLITRRGG